MFSCFGDAAFLLLHKKSRLAFWYPKVCYMDKPWHVPIRLVKNAEYGFDIVPFVKNQLLVVTSRPDMIIHQMPFLLVTMMMMMMMVMMLSIVILRTHCRTLPLLIIWDERFQLLPHYNRDCRPERWWQKASSRWPTKGIEEITVRNWMNPRLFLLVVAMTMMIVVDVKPTWKHPDKQMYRRSMCPVMPWWYVMSQNRHLVHQGILFTRKQGHGMPQRPCRRYQLTLQVSWIAITSIPWR